MAAGNLSLFGGSKLVDLRIPSGKPGREGSEALQRYIGTTAMVPASSP
jgi:DNA polymerase-3 subunit delta